MALSRTSVLLLFLLTEEAVGVDGGWGQGDELSFHSAMSHESYVRESV